VSALALEVAKFRQWARAREECSGEWECDYADWQSLYAALDDSLAAQHTITVTELELLLYALARDNEYERILETLEQFPGIALQVVQAAVSFPDEDARWQAAVLAGRIGATFIVRQFLNDDAEYVRRRAGFALQEMECRA
jgi:HEAT repeat protein